MSPLERFATLVSHPPAEIPLDEAALAMAGALRADVDEVSALATLDDLASRCVDRSFDGLRGVLFEDAGFRGNVARYDDPDNSFLDRVLDRRVGIPISLSAVMIAVGARIGVAVVGIGMPAHFIARRADTADGRAYCDPFNGGRSLDASGCAALFASLTGGTRAFHPSFLSPVDARQILSRMLSNLEHGPYGRDVEHANRLVDLHLCIPDLGLAERLALSQRLAQLARFEDAARVVEDISTSDDGDLGRRARALRARLN
jgi:regulator of sirC expression with transglutaminase-like and TPR domain